MEMRTVNCEAVVKQFCFEKLNMPEIAVRAIVFDRVHRIGRVEKLKPCGICPIHRYIERKKVQETWYEKKRCAEGGKSGSSTAAAFGPGKPLTLVSSLR